nr:uncharacterized protein LOC128689962 [Cherax quadricarinatus]
MYVHEGRCDGVVMVTWVVVVVAVFMVVETYTQHTAATTTLHNQHHLHTLGRKVDAFYKAINRTDISFNVGDTALELTDSKGSLRYISPLANKGVYVPYVPLENVSQQVHEGDDSSWKHKQQHKHAGATGLNDHSDWGGRSSEWWRECAHLSTSKLVQVGFDRAVSQDLQQCAHLWCSQVEGSEEREHQGGVYYVVQLGHVAENQHECLLNLTSMIILHHSWPMCSSDFVCATNHSVFEMSASDCMPWRCWAAETLVLVFMVLVSFCITIMSVIIMVVTVACPQFHKPKYYLRFSLAATDFFIGIIVCGHAAYNQWVGLTEVPFERFPYYANLKDGQLFRHVPNCLWGVSDVLTQISGFFVSANMIISLSTLSLMSLDRYLLLTRTHYRTLVTSRRVTAALGMSWCCGLLVPSLHFVYRPQMQEDICINYDTSSFDVHIINIESKIATADYKVYLKHVVPLFVTLVVVGLPIVSLLIFSFRALRKYNSYTRDRSVRQVKSALQLTQNHCSLSRQTSSTSLAAMVNLIATPTPTHGHHHITRGRTNKHASTPPPYKLKFIFKKKTETEDGGYDLKMSTSLVQHSGVSDADVDDYTSTLPGESILLLHIFYYCNLCILSKRLCHHSRVWKWACVTLVNFRTVGMGVGVTVRERDREITCTVLVNVAVFIFACFPLLGVGAWMMFLYFTHQDTINNPAPLKQLLFVAPWLMALNSLWNAVLHLSYNHKFRSATSHMMRAKWRKLCRVFCKHERLQE